MNTAGETHYAAVGILRKFGDKVFIRPGVGLAVHTGSARNFQDDSNDKLDFGSRILFEPELAIGARINDRMTIEASWVHMSHGTAVRPGRIPASTISASACRSAALSYSQRLSDRRPLRSSA